MIARVSLPWLGVALALGTALADARRPARSG